MESITGREIVMPHGFGFAKFSHGQSQPGVNFRKRKKFIACRFDQDFFVKCPGGTGWGFRIDFGEVTFPECLLGSLCEIGVLATRHSQDLIPRRICLFLAKSFDADALATRHHQKDQGNKTNPPGPGDPKPGLLEKPIDQQFPTHPIAFAKHIIIPNPVA
jgi:hypothetical protein